MDIWLSLRDEDPGHVLRILTNVGELLLPRRDGYDVDTPLEIVLQDEWTDVPGRPLTQLSAERLGPLAEVTERFRNLFTGNAWATVMDAVQLVIPSLEKRRDDGYNGPDDNVRRIICGLLLQQIKERQHDDGYDGPGGHILLHQQIRGSPTSRCAWPAP
jgi:hypothetical protein